MTCMYDMYDFDFIKLPNKRKTSASTEWITMSPSFNVLDSIPVYFLLNLLICKKENAQ